jgi:hypothetical protein
MFNRIFTILLILVGVNSYGQTDKNHFIGINLLQLPTSTINVNYSVDFTPYFTPVMDMGYAFGYNGNYDLVGMLLTPHIKLDDGYSIKKQSGGYVKIGGFLNLRKDFDQNNFPHFGLFLTNSIIREEGRYLSPMSSMPYHIAAKEIEHSVYLFGLNASIGYEFIITNRLKTHIDFQLSIPTDKYLDLYGYSNFIPGMGFKDTESNVFPMLILNLKYGL